MILVSIRVVDITDAVKALVVDSVVDFASSITVPFRIVFGRHLKRQIAGFVYLYRHLNNRTSHSK